MRSHVVIAGCICALGFCSSPASAQDLIDNGLVYSDFSPKTVEAGDSFTAACEVVENSGTTAAGPFTVLWALSTDDVYGDTNDIYLGEELVSGGLAAGASATVTLASFPFPGDIPPGTYYVIWEIDYYNDVAETDENNVYMETDTLTVLDDAHEEDDSTAQADTSAELIEEATIDGVCWDDDYYRITVLPGEEQVTAALSFVDADGNLDLALHDDSGTQLRLAGTTTDNEVFIHVVPAAGTYYLRVVPTEVTGNAYTISWSGDVPIIAELTADCMPSSSAAAPGTLVFLVLAGAIVVLATRRARTAASLVRVKHDHDRSARGV